MDTPTDIEQSVKQILRRLDSAVQRENDMENIGFKQSNGFPNQSNTDLLLLALFGISMGFVMLFTCALAILVNDLEQKVMFGSFAMISLIMCIYKLDRASRQFRAAQNDR